jgi:cytochrome P450
MFSREMLEDPYPCYHRLRAIDPVYWSEKFNAWYLTGYDAVAAGLNDLRLSSDRSALLEEMAGSKELAPFFSFLHRRMVLADPPMHTRLRGLVSKAFTPHVIEAMRPHIQQLVDGFLDAVQPTGRMDVVRDLAFPLPATVIMEMLGVLPEDRDLLKKWSDAFIVFFSTHPATISLEQYRLARDSMNAMVDYFRAALPGIRKSGRPCLLQTMGLAEDRGDTLSEEELFANANLLLVAGHETTTNLIGNGMLALLRHPEQMDLLRANPALVPGAVEEFLRYDAPVHFANRVAREDVEMGTKTIHKGQFVFLFLAAANRDPAHFPDPDRLDQFVFLFLAAANRDPAHFPDPDRLDVTRSVHKHLSFGLGHHFCLGAPLARLEAQIAFSTVLRRLPNLRLGADKVVHRDNFNLRGPQSLPVVFG